MPSLGLLLCIPSTWQSCDTKLFILPARPPSLALYLGVNKGIVVVVVMYEALRFLQKSPLWPYVLHGAFQLLS